MGVYAFLIDFPHFTVNLIDFVGYFAAEAGVRGSDLRAGVGVFSSCEVEKLRGLFSSVVVLLGLFTSRL
jgi:hypothetical protein